MQQNEETKLKKKKRFFLQMKFRVNKLRAISLNFNKNYEDGIR